MSETTGALKDFTDGFHAGYQQERREKNRGGIYNRAYRKGLAAILRSENGGEDVGDSPIAQPRRRKSTVAKAA